MAITGIEVACGSYNYDLTSALTGAITDTQKNPDGKLRCTDVAHGLLTGQRVRLAMTDSDHDGDSLVTRITDDLFDCDGIDWASDNDTGAWARFTHMYFVHRTVRMPSRFNTETPPRSNKYARHKLRAEVKLTDASVDLDSEWHIGTVADTDKLTLDYDGDIASPTWQTAVEQTAYPSTHKFLTKFSGTSEKPTYVVTEGRMVLDGIGGGDSALVYNVAFEAIFDSNTLDGEGYRVTERDTERIHAKDYPITAYHIQDLLNDSHEFMIYESRTKHTVPVFGVAT